MTSLAAKNTPILKKRRFFKTLNFAGNTPVIRCEKMTEKAKIEKGISNYLSIGCNIGLDAESFWRSNQKTLPYLYFVAKSFCLYLLVQVKLRDFFVHQAKFVDHTEHQ